ncbi:beta-glucosidase 12-like [Benincasa hispida]|uniref:beta-glucosidase 12-like n=1 Tax=Benincasa hispida TaxID=102211 RepID=UPI0019013F6F|nr:beta-glucosidase 12-like [Benincasa hispida]
MAFKDTFFLGFLFLILVASEATNEPKTPIPIVRRSNFPKDFVFGSSSAAYQYEGAAFKDGRGPSIWDTYTHQHPERIADGKNGDLAVDQYHRYKEDVAIMDRIGFDAYRFSISWSRVLPKGKLSGGVNKKGIDYYNKLINELLSKGIQSYVTIFHWDVPQALQDEYQGFMSRKILKDYRDFAELCFKEFGDRVKHWITFNEQYVFTINGYAIGVFAPGRCSSWQPLNCLGGDSGTEPYIVAHHLILAHALAARLYKSKYQAYQKGEIGVTLFSNWFVPYSKSEADKKATGRALDFQLGWFLDPIVYGDYPASMRTLVKERLPKFTKEERSLILKSYDFIGINYYTSNYVQNNPNVDPNKPSLLTDLRANSSTDRNGVSIGPKVNGSSWLAVYPEGLKDLMIHMKNNYKNPIIYITENGYLDFDSPQISKLIKDEGRVKYYRQHLIKLQESVKAGVRVKGFFAWSLLDNFEWANGYTMRFGLVYVDFKHRLTRIPKLSAKWFNNFLRS